MSFADHPQCAGALALAQQLADAARRIAVHHFRTPVAVQRKSDGTPVTAVDREIEMGMRAMIRAAE